MKKKCEPSKGRRDGTRERGGNFTKINETRIRIGRYIIKNKISIGYYQTPIGRT